ncbi:hypothetical protein THRCLA_22761 [Thraustotheca clavata]|uniref:WRKY19-like zinc finger domain-containing protein n=1 Tax=Thraustotheca clavata TaxID=74557 RepID=A0A1V9YTF0_9STRA|nr:hypothetical protein THRCLA_22761 [Thraustotheca clavata]
MPCSISGCTRFAKVTTLCLTHNRLHQSNTTSPKISSLPSSTKKEIKKTIQPSRLCQLEGCFSYARRHGRCSKHGGANICEIEVCTTPSQSRGRCRLHGGVDGCTKYAKVHSMCLYHNQHKTRSPEIISQTNCAISSYMDEINNKVPRSASRMCRVEGCCSYARRLGRCSRHGGSKQCEIENCTTPAQTGGLCRAHGGGTPCKYTGCKAFARYRGFCTRHAPLKQSPTKST